MDVGVDTGSDKSDEYEYYYVYYDEDGNVVNKKDFDPVDVADDVQMDTAQVSQSSLVHYSTDTGKNHVWSDPDCPVQACVSIV